MAWLYRPAPLGQGLTFRSPLISKEESFDFNLWNAEPRRFIHSICELRSYDHLAAFPIHLSYLRALPASQIRRLGHPCTCSFCRKRESYLVCEQRSQKPRKLKPRARASLGRGAQQNLAPPLSPRPSPGGGEKRWEGAGSRKLLRGEK